MPPLESGVLLRRDEIEAFYSEFTHDANGNVSFIELKRKLEEAYAEIAPPPRDFDPERTVVADNNNDKSGLGVVVGTTVTRTMTTRTETKVKKEEADTEATEVMEHLITAALAPTFVDNLHDFLCKLMPGSPDSMSKEEFINQVQSWSIPSQDQTLADLDKGEAKEHVGRISYARRGAAWCHVKGLETGFLVLVGVLIVAFSLWQGLVYATDRNAIRALGVGLVIAKFSAGALYPTYFFLILSMSRHFATFCRRSYFVSRFINWDLSQSFHIKMSCAALFFSCTHVIGHLTGTFSYGSAANLQSANMVYFGERYVRRSYGDFMATRAGWTGLVAFGCFIIIALTSMPAFRKRFYETFQAAHMLMYPMFATLAIHGTAKLLQYPILGYWLLFPVICVVLERSYRVYLTFFGHYPALIEALDDGTVLITAEKPEGKEWKARAGQYILLQVPSISRFQWHPFTISTRIGGRLQVHIKADGTWTQNLHKLATSAKRARGDIESCRIKVGIDGPFGAPAQRFYSFDKSIIVGAGIGVTPFSACLTDIEENFKAKGDPWELTRMRSIMPGRSRTVAGMPRSKRGSIATLNSPAEVPQSELTTHQQVEQADILGPGFPKDPGSNQMKRCDFHWSVREKNDLLWFSDLLNRASDLAIHNQHLTLNIKAHITAKRQKISGHIFRYLLDRYRTKEYPYSALTGLWIRSDFGRPDFEAILNRFYEDMKAQKWRGRVGVFHCGPSVIAEMLADLCAETNLKAELAGERISFVFHNEVFG